MDHTEALMDRVARAIEDAEVGYTMKLTKLVDGVSTYTLTYDDGSEPLEFDGTEDCYEHIGRKRALARARAAIEAANVPELVAILKETKEWIAEWSPRFTQYDDWREVEARIDAAIAKAEHPS